jgi:SAM-dependent methyltransferase
MEGVDPRLRDFYVERCREGDRLRGSPHGVLERVRTQELLARYLPPAPASILDVGGATGIHAGWLADRGYAVVVVDLIEEHVTAAKALEGVSGVVGDARALPQPDDSADAVLVLGPLYHLLERDARLAALCEARRVARPRAPVFAAAISRHAALMDIGADGRLTDDLVPFVRELHRTGAFDTDRLGFTHCHFRTPAELSEELAQVALADVEVFGIEGPAGPALDAHGIDRIDELLPAAVRAARIVDAILR